MGEFDGKVAVVTGGAKGIGRGAVEALAAQGAKVAVVDLDADAARALADEVGGFAATADVSSADDTARAGAEIADALGRIDVLVNNAGIQTYGTVVDTPEDVWDRTLGVNLKGIYLMSKACVPHILAAGGGAVVNIASVQGLATQRQVAAYAASKGGAVNLTRSMAMDLAPSIRVNAVCPGSVDTPMLRWAADEFGDGDPDAMLQSWADMHPLKRIATARQVGEVVAFLAGPRADFMTGSIVVVDGGLLAGLGGI